MCRFITYAVSYLVLLSVETSFHPQPSLIFLLGVSFFSVGGRVGTGIDDRLEGAGIVEVLSGFSQVQPNDLKIGIPFPGKWKPSKKFSVYGECGTCPIL